MPIKGMVGAVYENDAAPFSENIALLFNWELETSIRKETTFGLSGPELHGIPTGWHIKAEAYWAAKEMPKEQVFLRMFIGKGKDMRCLAGQVEIPTLKQTENICETEIKLQGIGLINQEG